jgi:8-oxo-dGTP pyrophosphatase MutT (NUDIX family)
MTAKPSADPKANPWTTLSTVLRYEDPWFRLLESQVIDPSGQRTTYRTLRYKKQAVCVLPIDANGCVTLVGQYRYALERYTWECPGGGVALDEPIEDGARRELAEETGLYAGHMLHLLHLDMSSGIGDERAGCFLAWDLKSGPANPDPSEVLRVRRVPLQEAVQLALTGGVQEAVSVALILRVNLMIQSREAPAEVQAAFDSAPVRRDDESRR